MLRLYGLVSAFLLFLATSAFGQSTTSLRGTVTDPTGAVVPGASLTLTNLATQATRETTSDESGSYVFPQLIPGPYQLRVSSAGFHDVLIDELRLLVNQPVTQNVRFETLGAVAETVSVSAEATQLNTTDASLGNAVGAKPIIELPFNARNVVGLLALQPGVVFLGDERDQGSAQFRNDSRSGAVNGARNDQNNITLDGVDVNDQMERGAFDTVLRVTLDAVQEFRTTTLNATADQGRSSGAQVALVTKSGTNELHGSTYWFHRNTVTTANGFFNNSAGVERPKLIRNIFGASLGGPIVKNRVFLFGNYEGRRDAREDSVLREVPTQTLRNGILQYRTNSGQIVQLQPDDIRRLIDPRGVNAAALSVLQGYPLPNDFSTGDGLNQAGFRFTAPIGLRWNTYIAKMDFNLDRAGRHTAFLRGNLQNDREDGVPQFPGMPPNNLALNNSKGLAFGVTSVLRPSLINDFRYGYTRQGRENTGIAKFAAVQFRGLDDPVGLNRAFRALIPVHTISDTATWTKNDHTVSFGFVARGVRNDRLTDQNSYSSASTNPSWLADTGYELIRNIDPNQNIISNLEPFRWGAVAVLGAISEATAQYNYLVDGTVLPQGAPVQRKFNNNEYEFFVSDAWRLRPNLTVTLGLRWQLMEPVKEANGQQLSSRFPLASWYGLRGYLAANGRSQAEAPDIEFVAPGDPDWRPLYPYHKKNFAPRVGVAWSPGFADGIGKFLFGGPGKTSIRAGWGMFYDVFGQGILRRFDATAFGLSNALTNPSGSLSLFDAPRFTGIADLPASLLPPAPPAGFPARYPDAFAITNTVDDSIVPPYSMTMNFNIGREFRNNLFVQAGYVGRLGRRLLVQSDLAMPTNLRDPKSGMTYFEAAAQLAELSFRGVPVSQVQPIPYWENLWAGYTSGGRTATQNVYARYNVNNPDFTSALVNIDLPGCERLNRCSILGPNALFNLQYSALAAWRNQGYSDYHGMQLNVRKTWNNGDLVDFNYTWSKSTDLSSSAERTSSFNGFIINSWFPDLMKGVSDFDTTHQFTANAVYNIPVGRGKRYLTGAGGLMDAFFGGWQLSTVFRATSGFPVGVLGSLWPTNWQVRSRARITGPLPASGAVRHAPAVNPGRAGPNIFRDPAAAYAAFQDEVPGGVGNRNIIRGDGVFQFDTNLAKRFQMPWKEGHTLQFRWEAFNLFNTTRFDTFDVDLWKARDGSFGRYQSTLSLPRVMQFGLRYDF
jgi:hypothetical protein